MVVVNYWGHVLGINIETEMRRRAFDHLQKLSFRFFDSQKTGHLVARVTKDLEEIGEVAHHGPEDLFIAVMTFLGALAMMLASTRSSPCITAAVVPVVGLVTGRYGSRMTRTWRELFGRVGAFNARIEENVGGIRVVQAFANEDHERRPVRRRQRRLPPAKLDAYRVMTASTSLSYFSMRFAQVIVMLAGTYFVLHHELTNGGFVAFLLLTGVFFRPLEKINAILDTYPKGDRRLPPVQELLATEPDIVDSPAATAVDHLRGDIRFDRVSFAYDGAAARAERRRPGHPGRRNRRLRRPVRGRQDDALLAPAAVLRRDRRPDHDRRHRHPRHDDRVPPPADRDRPAGRVPVRRHDPRERRLRPPGRRPRRTSATPPPGPPRARSRRPPGRPRHGRSASGA